MGVPFPKLEDYRQDGTILGISIDSVNTFK